jgi:hypothetical protein
MTTNWQTVQTQKRSHRCSLFKFSISVLLFFNTFLSYSIIILSSLSFLWKTGDLWVFLFFFIILACEAIVTAATPGLLCQPRVIMKMIVEKQMECRLAGEPEILGENLPQRHFCPSKNPTWLDPGFNPGRRTYEVTIFYECVGLCKCTRFEFWMCWPITMNCSRKRMPFRATPTVI